MVGNLSFCGQVIQEVWLFRDVLLLRLFRFFPSILYSFTGFFCTEKASFLRGDTPRCVSGLWAVERVCVGTQRGVVDELAIVETGAGVVCVCWRRRRTDLHPPSSLMRDLGWAWWATEPHPLHISLPNLSLQLPLSQHLSSHTHINALFWSLPALWCWYLA